MSTLIILYSPIKYISSLKGPLSYFDEYFLPSADDIVRIMVLAHKDKSFPFVKYVERAEICSPDIWLWSLQKTTTNETCLFHHCIPLLAITIVRDIVKNNDCHSTLRFVNNY
jgi:hypothetical protein